MGKSFLISAAIVLTIVQQALAFNSLSADQLNLCLREADSLLPSLPVPEILSTIFYASKGMRAAGKVFDTSHEYADKLMAAMNPDQQHEFDHDCTKFWPKMIQLRDSTSCGRSLEHYVGIYNLDRDQYLVGHQQFNDMIEMYELCFTVRCKQAYDRKMARLQAQ